MERLGFVVWVLAFWLWSILVFGFLSKVSANAEGACSDAFLLVLDAFSVLAIWVCLEYGIVICIC